jgi:hypothetical protein
MQRIERLHFPQLFVADVRLAQWRHAKVDEAVLQLMSAKATLESR